MRSAVAKRTAARGESHTAGHKRKSKDLESQKSGSTTNKMSEIFRKVSFSIAFALATGLYSGLSRFAPGTVGSLSCIPLLLGLSAAELWTTFPARVGCTLALLVLALWSTQTVLRRSPDAKDPQNVVIDEWIGMSVTLCAAETLSIQSITAAFLFFRVFDILKPGPIRRVERLPGAYGVIADDFLAGVAAAAALAGYFYLAAGGF